MRATFREKFKLIVLFIVVITLTGVMESLGIGVLMPIVDILQNSNKSLEYMDRLKQYSGIHLDQESFINLLFVGGVCVFIVSAIFQVFSQFLMHNLAEGVRTGWQAKIFKIYTSMDYSFFVKNKTGDLIQRQLTHTENAGDAIVQICILMRDIIMALAIYVMLLSISPKVTSYFTLAVVVFSALALVVAKIKIYSRALKWAEYQKDAFILATDAITGMRQIKAFCAESYFFHRFNNAIMRKKNIFIKNATIVVVPAILLRMLTLVGMLGALYSVTHYSENSSEMISLVALFGVAAYRIVSSLGAINNAFMTLAMKFPSLKIISGVLALEENLSKHEQSMLLPSGSTKEIQLRNVDFTYDVDAAFSLQGFHLKITQGSFVGVVGPSGSGKSSIVDLIMGFYQPVAGAVLIDGVDLQKLDLNSWRRKIGFVSQDTQIFSGSVISNISFASGAEEVDFGRVMQAAQAADLHDFIQGLPEGYQTTIGERGMNLSGGQRQRLAIARAIYSDPEFFILDEATSALDTHSEQRIQAAIEGLNKESRKTVIAVAHRLSTLRRADCIYVMEKGRIIEQGNHQSLMEQQGLYAQLYQQQNHE